MSDNQNSIFSKAVLFTIVTVIVILVGTVVTTLLPLAMDEMHPKLNNLQPYTALELAGRDIYQKEGCTTCHTLTVRPLKADVLRYGEYSKAGENYYEHPFLWGSKRTGPDLARIGGKYSDEWHIQHFIYPQAFYTLSNMPKYDWLQNRKVNVYGTERGMKVLGFPYEQKDIEELKDKTELDAIVAYMQVLGTSVEYKNYVEVDPEAFASLSNPNSNNPESAQKGRLLYETNCYACHGDNGQGTPIASAIDNLVTPDVADGILFVAIANGFREMMPSHINFMTKDDIWNIVSYTRQLAEKNATESQN